VRKVRHDAKIDVNHGRHQVREVHHVEKKKITRSPYEERNVRHNRITESSHGGHGWQAEKKKYK
jgi:hypothetical protein